MDKVVMSSELISMLILKRHCMEFAGVDPNLHYLKILVLPGAPVLAHLVSREIILATSPVLAHKASLPPSVQLPYE